MACLLLVVIFIIGVIWAESKDPGGPMPKPPKAPATQQEWDKYRKRLRMKEQAVERARIRKEIKDRKRRERAGEDLGENSSAALEEEYRRKIEGGSL